MIGPEVMLASSSHLPPEQLIPQLMRDGWFTELKFDGIRAVVSKPEVGRVQIFNRRQVDISHRYPDVVAQLQDDLDLVGLVDGEIVVAEVGGRPEFSLVHLRDAQSSERGVRAAMAKAPATFMPFDVLTVKGVDVRPEPYTRRRERLISMFPAGAVSLSSQDGATMWAFVLERKLEGLIAKRPDSAYRSGRQRAWIKIKSTRRLSALVCGVSAGKGSRGVIGALQLCLWDASTRELVSIGKVGSGLSDAQLRTITELLAAKTPIVVEVEYLEVSPSGQLRMPIFRGVRQDVPPDACTLDTLTER